MEGTSKEVVPLFFKRMPMFYLVANGNTVRQRIDRLPNNVSHLLGFY